MTLSQPPLLDHRVRAGEGVPLALGVGREPVCLCIFVSVHVCVVKPDGRGGGEIKTCMCIYVAKSCGGVCICERERKKT